MSSDQKIIKNKVGLLKLSETTFARSRPSSAIRGFKSRIGSHLWAAGNSSSYAGAFF